MNEDYSEFQSICFPFTRKEDWHEVLTRKLINLEPGTIIIDCQDWVLGCKDFQKIKSLSDKAGLKIKFIQSTIPETLVSASSLGHQTLLTTKNKRPNSVKDAEQ